MTESLMPDILRSNDHGKKVYFEGGRSKIVPEHKSGGNQDCAASTEPPLMNSCWNGDGKSWDAFDEEWWGWYGDTVKYIPFDDAPVEAQEEYLHRLRGRIDL